MPQQLVSRRSMLAGLAAVAAGRVSASPEAHVRIGIMDHLLGAASQPEAIAIASSIGFQGVQLILGRPDSSGRLPLFSPSLQEQCLAKAHENNIALTSTYLDVLHQDCLKNNLHAQNWIKDGIAITKTLDAHILMLVFFGKCALESAPDIEAVIEPLRLAAGRASDAGVILGFENTLSGETNARVLERVNSPALKVFYDIGNSTNIGHYDVAREIRMLGRERICQFHIKDKSYLGTGKVDVPAALSAIRDIGFSGFTVLETTAPSGDRIADAKRNLQIYTKMLTQAKLRS